MPELHFLRAIQAGAVVAAAAAGAVVAAAAPVVTGTVVAGFAAVVATGACVALLPPQAARSAPAAPLAASPAIPWRSARREMGFRACVMVAFPSCSIYYAPSDISP
ncbi:MAG: hypothetical protein LC793_20135 [Thermomicrobia bacterium]|nr:hypothetical protein [Thermomicrobia bacterium]